MRLSRQTSTARWAMRTPTTWRLLRIELKRNPGAASAGGFGATFAEQALFEQAADDVADAVGRLAGAFVEFPPAEASLIPEDLDDFFFARV